jgi:glutaminyl-tRNA synthetase
MRLNSTQNVVSVRYGHPDIRSLYQSKFAGFSITSEELHSSIISYIRENAVTGWHNLGPVISGVKASPALRWANPLEVKNAVERAFIETFGVKEALKPKAKVRHFIASRFAVP